MQKQKFDEIVSYFNKKVSEMEIETKYKMELLGMVTALGCAHEKETHDKRTETHACENTCEIERKPNDMISRADVCEILSDMYPTDGEKVVRAKCIDTAYDAVLQLPSAKPTYTDAEIQKMQDLESAEIEKAYQLGYEEGKKDAQPNFDTITKIDKAHDDGYEQGYLQGKADYERKKGKWTIKNGELAFWDVCSECKRMVIHKAPFYNFCPHCGAMMKDGDDNA